MKVWSLIIAATDTMVASMERLLVKTAHVNEALAPVGNDRRLYRNNAQVVRLIGARMDTKAAFVRSTVALVTGALKVAAIGVVISA
jgi:hypothetical protein